MVLSAGKPANARLVSAAIRDTREIWASYLPPRDRAHVIEVGVREQDGLDRGDLKRLERTDEALGLIAGIDHHGTVSIGEPDDVGVLLHRPDGEHPDVDHRFCSCFRW